MFPGKNKVRGLERHPDIYPFCQFHEKCPHFSLPDKKDSEKGLF
jgi:hypothetical protein